MKRVSRNKICNNHHINQQQSKEVMTLHCADISDDEDSEFNDDFDNKCSTAVQNLDRKGSKTVEKTDSRGSSAVSNSSNEIPVIYDAKYH